MKPCFALRSLLGAFVLAFSLASCAGQQELVRPAKIMEIKAKLIDTSHVKLYAMPDSLCETYSVRDWRFNRNNPDSVEAKITCGRESLAFFWLLPSATDSSIFVVDGQKVEINKPNPERDEKIKKYFIRGLIVYLSTAALFLVMWFNIME